MGTKRTREYKVRYLRQNIAAFFKARPNEAISKTKLLGQFALDTMSTKRTGQEILQLLADVGEIQMKGDNIYKNKWMQQKLENSKTQTSE